MKQSSRPTWHIASHEDTWNRSRVYKTPRHMVVQPCNIVTAIVTCDGTSHGIEHIEHILKYRLVDVLML